MSRAVHEWSTNPALNNGVPADGHTPELMPRSEVNNASRARMAGFRDYYDDPEWLEVSIRGPLAGDIAAFNRVSGTQFTLSLSGVDLSGFFTDGRIIKIKDGLGSGVDLITQVNGDAGYSDPLTTVDITVTDTLDAVSSGALCHAMRSLRALALVDAETPFFVPATDDSAGINAAIALADAAGGGMVLLTANLYLLEAQIDLTTKGSILLRGGYGETVLRQVASAAIDPLFTMGHASESNELENIQIDMNGNPGTLVEVDGQARARFFNVVFSKGDIQVELTATTATNILFDNCFFSAYEHFGITTNGPSDTHTGQVRGCRFQQNATPTISDPAAAKLSGQWVVSGNQLGGIGHTTHTPRGIWMWNETLNDGGLKSTVIGNSISSSGTNGTMIEVGGDWNTVVGNYMSAPSAGIGIHVNGTTAGQFARRNTISANTISGGRPIVANERSQHASITGNYCEAATGECNIETDGDRNTVSGNTTGGGQQGCIVGINGNLTSIDGNHFLDSTVDGIDVLGDFTSVVGNKLAGIMATCIRIQGDANRAQVQGNVIQANATIGIEVVGNPTKVRLYANSITDSTTGINLGADVVDARLKNNDCDGSSAGLVDSTSGGTINRFQNSFDTHLVESTGTPLPRTGLAMPCGGGPGLYRVTAEVKAAANGSAGTVTAGVYIGPLGTSTDPLIVVANAAVGTSSDNNAASASHPFVGASGDTLFSIYRSTDNPTASGGHCTIEKIAMD